MSQRSMNFVKVRDVFHPERSEVYFNRQQAETFLRLNLNIFKDAKLPCAMQFIVIVCVVFMTGA